ncbi:MAG: hypothetical protein L0G63_02115 [Psychrobacter sp.]|uniref:hypothetical protein n=1 Tax=Psychrobacter sp. TaxID=56811 RepID=UPI0026499FBC|nr:hypothetical protein [Psychrobacter sp.]MDN5619264.1 hypothetical protein [Psychrobacter sp.]
MKAPDNKGVFYSPHAHIVDSFNVYKQKPPPADHPNAIVCGQCEDLTWRMTDRCIHCNFDIAADALEQQRLQQLEQLRFELQQLKDELRPFLVLMAACAIALVLTFFIAPQMPYVYWVVLGAMIVLAAFIKPLDDQIKSTQHQIQELR